MAERLNVDICVIGGGSAGLVVAARKLKFARDDELDNILVVAAPELVDGFEGYIC